MLRSRIVVSLLTSLIMVVSGLGVAPVLVSSQVSASESAVVAHDPTVVAWLHTDGSEIVTSSGDDFTIKAVSWFGMETSNCAPHGLWLLSLDQAMDQIASFGFNAIRLPFSSECLAGTAASVSGVDSRVNPDLQGLRPIELMDRVVAAAAARNLRVLLDRHRPDSGSQSELWYTDRFPEQRWIADWVSLANRYARTPTVIGADLHNEPHGRSCWGCGDPTVDWAAAATRAGNAVLAANPHWLIVVEGVERQAAAGDTWWGGGLADAAVHPITLTVPDQLVYSAHDYPASIYPQTWFADPAYPSNLPGLWDRDWGYLQRQHIAPVLLGEFGTKLGTESDKQWLGALVGYLSANRIGFAYWSYNPNSGDTGGLVADDWRTPQQAKLDALAPLLSGLPSAVPPTGPAAAPTPPPSPAPTTRAPLPAQSRTAASGVPSSQSPTPVPAQPATGGSAVNASWQLQSSWTNGYVAQLVVTATTQAADQWSMSWPDPHAQSIANAWGMNCTVSAGEVRCRSADWASRILPGGSVTVGVQVIGDGIAPAAPVLTVG